MLILKNYFNSQLLHVGFQQVCESKEISEEAYY